MRIGIRAILSGPPNPPNLSPPAPSEKPGHPASPRGHEVQGITHRAETEAPEALVEEAHREDEDEERPGQA
jgi:hypothetical protein